MFVTTLLIPGCSFRNSSRAATHDSGDGKSLAGSVAQDFDVEHECFPVLGSDDIEQSAAQVLAMVTPSSDTATLFIRPLWVEM